MTGRRLVLMRHGRTAWNDMGKAQGHTDIELDAAGHAQAAAVTPYLVAMRPAALWTSDLARARQTCAYLEQATGLSAKADERLREYDVGARQALTPAEFAAAFPEAHAAWQGGDDMPDVPGAERVPDVEARIVPALREAFDSLEDGQTGIVVTHGACLRVGLVALLGWPRELSAGLTALGNCAWVVVGARGAGDRLRLEAYNRTVEDGSGRFASPPAVG